MGAVSGAVRGILEPCAGAIKKQNGQSPRALPIPFMFSVFKRHMRDCLCQETCLLEPLILKRLRFPLRFPAFLFGTILPDPAVYRIGHISSCVGFFFGVLRFWAAKSDHGVFQQANAISLT